MSRQHSQSCDCTKSELNLFGIPPTQTTIEHGFWTDVHPVATLEDRAPIEFHISGDGENYIDLANTFLHLQASIRTSTGDIMSATDVPGPVNNWLHSLFEEVTLTLGDTVVSSTSNAYPYRAYLENLLTYGSDAVDSQLSCGVWFKDSANAMDAPVSSKDGSNNVGLRRRGALTQLSRPVEMVGRLHTDVTLQDRLLINNVPVKVKLNRSKDEFSIMAPTNGGYKVKIHSAVLYYRSVKISDSILTAQEKTLTTTPAKYPINRVQIKYFAIPSGMTSYNHENLFRGQVPTRIVIGCVDTSAFNGKYDKNPFNFQHKYLSKAAIYLADAKSPIKPLTPSHPNHNLLSYMSVFTGTGKWGKDEGCGFSRWEYPNGYCLYAWDLTPDLSDGGDHFQLMKNSNIRLELQFDQPLTETTTVVVYSEFQNMIMIDIDRNVTTNYTS